jgi:DNA-binding NarL/FixJ family response regulator
VRGCTAVAVPNEPAAGGRGRRRDTARRHRYAPAFGTLDMILAGLREAEDRELLPLLAMAETLQSQLREAIRRGPAEVEQTAGELRVGWDELRSQLRVLSRRLPAEAVPLSPREIEVLRRVATGLANKEIAADLGISSRTVRNHVSNIYLKLGISGRAEAAVTAVRLGVLKA